MSRQHLEELRKNHEKRLQILESKAARFGISTPPEIVMEIEDIKKEIAAIDEQLVGSGVSISQTSNQSIVSVLFLSADPTNASRLRLGEELREIQEKLRLARLRDQFVLEERMSVRPADISQALLDVQPQIVHFSGHGTSHGALCFENQIGEMHLIQPEAIAALFEQFANQVKCVLLNACYSEAQANAIAKHIDYVIGMNQAIADKAAIAFAIGFYQALGAARTIEEAYKLGCVQIRLHNIPEHLTPVLIKKVAVSSS
ncbi:CHAT domain-containing protein [bacterium]|nr:CHAT domain-containing protein [bacterium]